MRYGREMTIDRQGDVVTSTERMIVNWQNVKQTTICTEIVRVHDDKQILAEFLKLLDRMKAGEIDHIGLQVVSSKHNESVRIEKTWSIPNLS